MSELTGVFGGTFDPLHFAHLRLAEEAMTHLGLGQIRWIPAGCPAHRETPEVTAKQRLEMVVRATADNPRFVVDAAEVMAERTSYTVETLERLRAGTDDQPPLVLLLGADAFAGLAGWHRWRELFALAHVAVAHRPDFPIVPANLSPELAHEFSLRYSADAQALGTSAGGRIVSFAMTRLAISATQIRQLLVDGQSARYLLPDVVLDYIQTHQLYRNR